MKTIMIAAPSSGSGKTILTMGLIRALKKNGYDVSSLKTGPDYIDTAFLKAASGAEAGNLDLHLQGREGVKQAFSLAAGDCCIVEGAMGYFDGISNTFSASSYDISTLLNINTILIYTPEGEMFTAIPKIKGMAEFEASKIKALILNRVNVHHYRLLKEQIDAYTGLKVLGYLPPLEKAELDSRHLGLVQSIEIDDLDAKINHVAGAVEKTVALEALVGLMSEVRGSPFPQLPQTGLKVAIARDKAFSFYYRENLKLFEDSCHVRYFSPLDDYQLPACDLLYLGGGYPEVFRNDLALNNNMCAQIKAFADQGGCIYAECGGMLYLMRRLEDRAMCGVFPGTSKLTSKLQRFGYIDITLLEDCLLGKKGDQLTAHEFHKTTCTPSDRKVFNITKPRGTKTWSCGYRYKNTLAAYPHINFLGNLKAFKAMLEYVKANRL